jgi:translation initiation factor IF-3
VGSAGCRHENVPVKIRKNDDLLTLTSIQVVDLSGEKLGVMTPAGALRLAREQGLDLVEVSPTAQPPVCKILNLAKFTYEEAKKTALRRRGPEPMVFLVRSKIALKGRPGTFLVGDVVTGDAVRAGMIAHIPYGHDILLSIPVRAVEFVDHMAAATSELALHVIGDTPEQVAAMDALVGGHLVEIVGPFESS